jgi:hypothetical protein
MSNQVSVPRRTPAVIRFALILLMPLLGCHGSAKPLPTTYPVHGKVTCQDGRPVADALVQFRPKSESRVITSAVTASDGAYTLVTKREGLKADGAVAGPNQVIVTYPRNLGSKQATNAAQSNRQPKILTTEFPAAFEVQPKDNEINLTVPNPKG